jgi:hypothetical protein
MLLPNRSPRPVSERRAAAARANGAKSRGPRTAEGKAASSRNSFRHGLRAQTLFSDPDSQREIAADYHLQLASYWRELRPKSETEAALVRGLVLAQCLRDRIHRLETSILEQEIQRQATLHPAQAPATVAAMAFESLCDGSCVLQLLNRFASRYARQFDQALRLFTELRSTQKRNIDERTQQVIENTSAAFLSIWNGVPPAPCSAEINIDERTQQPVRETNVNERTQQPVFNPKRERGENSTLPLTQAPLALLASLPPDASYNPTKGSM